MTADDLLIGEAARSVIRYNRTLGAFLHDDEVCPVFEAAQLNDLVNAGRLTVRDGLVLPAEQAEVTS